MIGKLVLILVVCLGSVGFYLHNYGYLPTIISHIQTTLTSFYQNNVLALPIIGGLCSALAGLIVKKATSNTTKSLQSNLDIANLANTESQNQITSLQNKLDAYKTQFGSDVVGKVQDLTTQLNEAQNTITTQKDELNISIQRARSLEAERNHLQDQLKDAQNQIDILEGRVKPPIE